MAVAGSKTKRCTPEEWKEFRSLVYDGMLSEVADWITAGKATLRPHHRSESLLKLAVESRNLSMVKLLWEKAHQDPDEAARCLPLKAPPRFLKYLVEAGCPLEWMTFSRFADSNDLDLIHFGLRHGVKVDGPDGWADCFTYSGSKVLLRFFIAEKHRIPGLWRDGVRALCESITESRVRAVALLVWAGVDPLTPCPSDLDRWDEPESDWDACPAEYLRYSKKPLNVFPHLKLSPSADQWLKLLEAGTFTGALLEVIIALRRDGPEFLRTRREAAGIVRSYFISICVVAEYPDRAREYVAASETIMGLGAPFSEIEEPEDSCRFWLRRGNGPAPFEFLELAWNTGGENSRRAVRNLICTPKLKTLCHTAIRPAPWL